MLPLLVFKEMTWLSLKHIGRYSVMLKFWNRLVKLNNTRLTKRVFMWCYDNPENNWCEDIRQVAENIFDILFIDTYLAITNNYVM